MGPKQIPEPEPEDQEKPPPPPKAKPIRVKVSGAGSKSYNGIYVQMQEKDKLSTRNGAAQLVLMSKDETFGEPDLSRIIFRDIDTKGAKWWLFPAYFNNTAPHSEVPPQNGWQANVGHEPAPTLIVLPNKD